MEPDDIATYLSFMNLCILNHTLLFYNPAEIH